MSEGAPLGNLPPELLNKIVSYSDTITTLFHISLTSKYLSEYISKYGFQAFVQSHFPHASTPPHWAEAARALTTLSRAWSRRSLTAVNLRPPEWTTWRKQLALSPARARNPGAHQSMGFQPALDCREDWPGGAWADRREILACGAGPELLVRIRRGCVQEYAAVGEAACADDSSATWLAWRGLHHRDGFDDINSVHLLDRPSPADDAVHAIVGRASGELRHVRVGPGATEYVTHFDTDGQSVRSTALSSGSDPLLAVCVSEATIALYPTHLSDPQLSVSAIDKLLPITVTTSARAWTPNFLSSTRLAIGRGPSAHPLAIHALTPTGIIPEPLQTFPAPRARADSVYAIAALTAASSPTRPGPLFLAAYHSGALHLHDQRQSTTAAVYRDPIDPDAPLYSLLPFGHARVVAGSGRHAQIKVFDLRLSGGRACASSRTADTPPLNKSTPEAVPTPAAASASTVTPLAKRTDCSVFLRSAPAQVDYSVFLAHRTSRRYGAESPVYALAAASSSAPTFYAGMEEGVTRVDVAAWAGRRALSESRLGGPPPPVPLKLVEHGTDPIVLRGQTYPCARTEEREVGWDSRWGRATPWSGWRGLRTPTASGQQT